MVKLLAVLTSTAALLSASGGVDRLGDAASTLREIMHTSDRGIPQDLLDKAQCVAVIPGLKKGAFIVGAKYGRGFFSCRKKTGVGWSAPAAIRIEGGSVGFQIGGSETDLVMLVLNERGAQKLLSSKFTVGGEGSVAAGPVGRTSTAETDAFMHAEILSWSRTRGVFAGISLKGATFRPDGDTNSELYGKQLENREIVSGSVEPPPPAEELIGLLNKYSSRK
jgi:lipid-binding SYLF domain-containing protein